MKMFTEDHLLILRLSSLRRRLHCHELLLTTGRARCCCRGTCLYDLTSLCKLKDLYGKRAGLRC